MLTSIRAKLNKQIESDEQTSVERNRLDTGSQETF